VLGKTSLTLTHKEFCCIQPVYIVKDITNNLLGFPTIKALKLLSHVQSVVDDKIFSQYPSLFMGLGSFSQDYNAQPYALSMPRNIPLALRQKVQTELQCMEALGVISRVKEPTAWCAAMVVVPKTSGAVRNCVDLKPLNENVLHETHPINLNPNDRGNNVQQT